MKSAAIDSLCQDLRRFVGTHRSEIRALLDQMVAQHSITWFKEGVDAVGRMAVAALPHGFADTVHPQAQFGDHHVLHRPGKAGALRVVLVGHLDTLCPENPNFDRVVERNGTLIGPGVMDMKGGDVVLIWALRALAALNRLDDLDVTVIFNSDEELGSPTSHPLMKAMKGQADLALVFEASSPEGSVVTTRRGVWRNRLHIEGVEHHFGMLRDRKVSALVEAAEKVLSLEALNRPDGSLAVNVGRVEGGLAANKVAHQAVLEYETRAWDADLHARLIEEIERQMLTPAVEGCRLRLEHLSDRPPMQLRPAHRPWLDVLMNVAAALGEPMVEESRGGVSDACWLSHVGIPTLDGLGPRGAHDFTTDEFCFTESLYDRIVLVACFLASVATTRPAPPLAG